jgi:hypothetical protein
MTECFKGDEIDFDEIIDPNKAKYRDALFKFLGTGLSQGPSMPHTSMPINAPNDPNMAAGMNMFREMGGLPTNYTPWQAPQYWNPLWNPQWPHFSGYNPDEGKHIDGDNNGNDDDNVRPEKKIIRKNDQGIKITP